MDSRFLASAYANPNCWTFEEWTTEREIALSVSFSPLHLLCSHSPPVHSLTHSKIWSCNQWSNLCWEKYCLVFIQLSKIYQGLSPSPRPANKARKVPYILMEIGRWVCVKTDNNKKVSCNIKLQGHKEGKAIERKKRVMGGVHVSRWWLLQAAWLAKAPGDVEFQMDPNEKMDE